MLSPAYSILLAMVAAAAAGLVGAFALMKRTILAGDVMSHIAIPGLGLAVVWKINPLVGGGLTLLLGIVLIARIEHRTRLSTEAAIGVMFASSVAIGALLIHSNEALIDALFGGFGQLSAGEFAFGMVASLVVIVAIWVMRNTLIIALFSPELAASTGIVVNRADLYFLLIFGL
ncbi:MAG TPA: metal ABC transporter permease, partial [Gemmatimonadaceae bacterium]|nr:metal ABC transporter permease [Gemmatimonadaceae bacterium]